MAAFRLLSLIEVVEGVPRADEVDLRECVGRPGRIVIMIPCLFLYQMIH